MRLDNVVMTCGADLTILKTLPVNSGMVFDVKRFDAYPTLSIYTLIFVVAESAINEYPFIAYFHPISVQEIIWSHLSLKCVEITQRPPKNAWIVVPVGTGLFASPIAGLFSRGTSRTRVLNCQNHTVDTQTDFS